MYRRQNLRPRSTYPNIITIYDIASENGVDFIAMEYVPGKALNRLISRKGLAVSDVLKFAMQISDALVTVHVILYFRASTKFTLSGHGSSRIAS